MPPQVLISYESSDRDAAERARDGLESAGIPCWFAPRDIPVGRNWSAAIVEALEVVKVAVVVVSKTTSESKHVAREVERADSKGKLIVPFFLDDVAPEGSLEYYFGAAQRLSAYPGPVEEHLPALLDAVRQGIGRSRATPQVPQSREVTDEDLVALCRSICWEIHEELGGDIEHEEMRTISEPKHGQQVKFIDLAANRRARRAITHWETRHGCKVVLTGEDLPAVSTASNDHAILCLLDSLDGTQHWLRSRNLYCTAVSVFQRDVDRNGPYKLRVSMVQQADGTVFFAREDSGSAFIDGIAEPLNPLPSCATDPAQAHVCTVARRPDHYRVLAPHLVPVVPFAGLYTFGGNPILAELALGRYDAVFQPDASRMGDSQAIWDWLAGGHIAYRAGCAVVGLDGQTLDVPAAAEACLVGRSSDLPFVAAGTSPLAEAIVRWLRAAG